MILHLLRMFIHHFQYQITPCYVTNQSKTELTAMGIIQTKDATSKRQAMKTPKRQKNKNLKIQNKKPSTEIVNGILFHAVVQNLLSIIINLEILSMYMDNFFP